MVKQDRNVDDMPWNLILQIGAFLLLHWPEPTDLTAQEIGFTGKEREFVQAMIVMQDSGWIMYEAIMIGTSAEAWFLSVNLTAKGKGKINEIQSLKR